MNSAFVIRGSEGCSLRRDSGAFTIMAGQRGRQGRPGTDSGGGVQVVIRQAGETVSALRVVYESESKAYLVDPNTDSVHLALGVTLTSSAPDGELSIQTQGFIDDPAWSWAEGLVWCGSGGALTQTPPETGWDFVIGFATSPTRLYIDLNEPVLLA